MARTRKKNRKIQFQISWRGLAALTVSTVCVFLWVFILGFWVGQKLTGRSMDESLQTQVIAGAVPETRKEKTTRVTPVYKAPGADDVRQPHKEVKKAKKKSTYFGLQIASYREKDRANKEAKRWRDKGYRAKVRRTDLGPEKGIFYRVYLGEYHSVEEAKSEAKKMAQKHNLKSYIVPIHN